MFDAQAWYARDYMLGKISLPSKEKMTANSLEWRKREDSLKDDEQKIWFQGDYTKELIEATDYPNFDPNDADLEHIAELIKQGYHQGQLIQEEEN